MCIFCVDKAQIRKHDEPTPGAMAKGPAMAFCTLAEVEEQRQSTCEGVALDLKGLNL